MTAKKWLTAGVAVTMLSTVLVGCGDNKDNATTPGAATDGMDATQELNLLLGDEIPTMDPSKATNTISFTLFAQINEGLVRLDEKGKAIPGMAKDWKVSQDGLTYTFTLRDDAKWTNGDLVTAHDFEYSWKRTLDPKTGAEYAFMMSWVKGGSEYNGGKGTAEDVAVKAKDDKTLEVTLVNPIPFFVEQMAFPIFFPQNKKFAEAAGDKYGTEAEFILSNGPFKFTSWVHEQSATIEKNETYYEADKVKLSKVNYQIVKDTQASLNLYEGGQIDRAGLVRDQVDNWKDNKEEFQVVPELTTGYLQYNQKQKALTSAKVRRALTWAIDADAFADVVFHNGTKGATGYTPAGISNGQGGDFTKDVGDNIKRADNKSKARAEFEAGLKEAGVTEFPKMKLLVDDGDVGKKIAEFIVEQWRVNLGITVEAENVPYKLRLKRSKEHDFDIVYSTWGADYNDPMTFLDMFITDGDFNAPSWSNKEYDGIIADAQKETDPKKRMDSLVKAEKLLMQEMPVGPMIFRGKAFVMKPYVKNFIVRQFGPDYDLRETYIQGKDKE